MAITVRNGSAKWKRNTQNAGPDYAAGAANPRRSWQQATVAAAQAYAQGVQTAIANGTFAKGAQKAGDGKWQARVQGVGVQRFGAGVAASGDAYDQGFAPYAQVLASLVLPTGDRAATLAISSGWLS